MGVTPYHVQNRRDIIVRYIEKVGQQDNIAFSTDRSITAAVSLPSSLYHINKNAKALPTAKKQS